MATILITGGTGLIGAALTEVLLLKGYKVIILTRQTDKKSANPALSYANWDINKKFIDESIFTEVTHIIHLAGAGVADKRWSEKRKKEIVDSRVKSGELLVQTLGKVQHKVEAVISSSAIGWYGHDPVVPNPSPFTEDNLAAADFLGATCKLWEESINPVNELGIRLVKLRTGIVLSKKGGALKEFIKPQKFGVAAILGNGKQIISWIHIDDMVNMYVEAIENNKLNGVYNAVAPNPVSNKELTIALAKARGKFYIPVYVPSFVLKIVLGEMSVEVLKSATVSAAKIIVQGFVFRYPTIADAVKAEVKP